MMAFDKNKATAYARTHALPPYGAGKCAHYVNEALENGGLVTTGHPAIAKDWGPTLTMLGFLAVSVSPALAETGDVIVIQPIAKHPYGHIEIYDGKNWVSDFIQDDMWPARAYEAENAAYQMYRYKF